MNTPLPPPPPSSASPGPEAIPPAPALGMAPRRPTGAVIVAAALVVVGLIVAAAIVFAGGSSDSDDTTTRATDDTRERSDDSGPPATFFAPIPTTEPAPPTTRPPLSVAPTRPTLPVTTAPPATPAPVTAAPTTAAPVTAPPATATEEGFELVMDDTGTFTVQVGERLDYVTTPLEIGTTVAHVSASTDLTGYLAGDFSIVGYSVLMAPTDVVGGIEGVLTSFDPLDSCGRRRDDTTFLATVGSGVMRTFVQCDGDNAEVLIALEGSGMTTLVALQGPNPEIGLVEDTAAAIARSVAFAG